MEKQYTAVTGDKTITIKSGKIAKQASGAVIVQQGETMVMVSAVSSKDPVANQSFLPLSVEYQEKIYAAGRIPGNYFRREMGRPSESEVLTCRLIDRPIRPLFPKDYFCEIQVIGTVLSMDKENEPDVLAMLGASAALCLSDIPFEGPIASVRIARVAGEYIINPTISESVDSDINIVVAGSKTGVIMVEGAGGEANEADMLDAIFHAHTAMQPLIAMQEEIIADLGKEKRKVEEKVVDLELLALVESKVSDKIRAAVQIPNKTTRSNNIYLLKKELKAEMEEDYSDRMKEVSGFFDKVLKNVSRDIVLNSGKRIDGRDYDEIRGISCETTILPRTHGSALFTRGETQVLGVLTLGTDYDEQRVETLAGDTTKPFMLHYNFPPFSVGECRRAGGPSRRDIGHGELATRAISHVLPSKEDFDYTIRIVGEVMESNGSSSMGTVCSGIMALMDGGVPIKAPVSGIAMGLVKEGDKVVILSDILGDEDHTGDMDFKVAGTREGITALQMDIKIKELSKDIMEKALAQAYVGRNHILDEMLSSISESRTEISGYAPKVLITKVKSDKIRDIIGPGGKVIKGIQSETGARIEITDDGTVKISADTNEKAEAALKIVNEIGTDPEVGAIYEGTVAKTTDFGAFVTIKAGTDGLVHISELADYRVKRVNDIVNEGDVVKVKVLEVSRDGRIRLSMKAVEKDAE